MTIIAIFYIIAAFLAIAACIPQVLQLIKVKCSDEFELTTWGTWMIAQAVSLAYVASLGNQLLIITNGLWVTFYAVMFALILWYRPKSVFRFRIHRFTAEATYHDNT